MAQADLEAAACSPAEIFRALPVFNGDGDFSFSDWYRRFEDLARAAPVRLHDQLKVNSLIAHLDGGARDKVGELTDAQRNSLDDLVRALKDYYESDLNRTIARQTLTTTRQEPNETVRNFAERLRKLLRVAYTTYTPAQLEERSRDDFIDRLKPAIRFHVVGAGPQTFEEAVKKAQIFEALLNDAATKFSINPMAAAVWEDDTQNVVFKVADANYESQFNRRGHSQRFTGQQGGDFGSSSHRSQQREGYFYCNQANMEAPQFRQNRYNEEYFDEEQGNSNRSDAVCYKCNGSQGFTSNKQYY